MSTDDGDNSPRIAVVFDLLGVISKEGFLATKIVYPLVGDKVSYDLFKKKYLMYSLGLITEAEFWEHIIGIAQIPFLEQQILNKIDISADIKKVCSSLIEHNCDLYLASEIPRKWGELIIKKAEVEDCFTEFFYSSDMKITKPFRGYYDLLFRSILGEGKTKIYYVDDTLINLKVGALYGVETVYFKERVEDADHITHFKINCLLDLLKIILKDNL